jgi:hypothetical protein
MPAQPCGPEHTPRSKRDARIAGPAREQNSIINHLPPIMSQCKGAVHVPKSSSLIALVVRMTGQSATPGHQ